MARATSKSRTTSSQGWFSHRQLVMLEAVLLVGLGKETLEWVVLEQSGLPPLTRVAIGMFVVVSTLGGLVFAAQKRLRVSLDKTQKAVRKRVRVPQALLHVAFLMAIFVAYAAFWDQETGALRELVRLAGEAWAWCASQLPTAGT